MMYLFLSFPIDHTSNPIFNKFPIWNNFGAKQNQYSNSLNANVLLADAKNKNKNSYLGQQSQFYLNRPDLLTVRVTSHNVLKMGK